jgi:hypothetical protein
VKSAHKAKPVKRNGSPCVVLRILKEITMRILKFSAALALIAGSLGLATGAQAQHYDHGRDRMVRVDDRGDHARRDDRRYRRDDRRYSRHDRRGYRSARHCRTEWRHHRRIRVCR